MSITARVVRTTQLTPHVRELYLQPATPIEYKPGQWVSLALPIGQHPPLKRVYSMASPMREDGLLHLIFDQVPNGAGSSYLAQLAPGAEVEIKSYMGNFILPEPLQPQLLFVARYTGVVPVMAILTRLAQQDYLGSVHLIYSSPDDSERFFVEELSGLSLKRLSVDYLNLNEHVDDNPDALAALAYAKTVDLKSTNGFVCGVGEMVRPLRRGLIDLGLPKRQVRAERFT